MNAFADLGYPEGFQPLQRRNPLLDLLGPFLVRGEGDSLELGLLLDERHTNSRGGISTGSSRWSCRGHCWTFGLAAAAWRCRWRPG